MKLFVKTTWSFNIIYLMIITLTYCYTTSALANTPSQLCSAFSGEDGDDDDDDDNAAKFSGSALFAKCQKRASTPWNQLVDQPAQEEWNPSWKIICKKVIENVPKVEPTASPMDMAQREQRKNAIKSSIKSYLKTMYKCMAMAYVTDKSDYSIGYRKIIKSTDGELSCDAMGASTQDYDSCKNLIKAYDGARVADTVLTAGQQIDYNMKAGEAMKDASQDMAGTGALKAYKTSLKKQEQIANVKAGFYVSKLGLIWAMRNKMPTFEDLLDKCRASGIAEKAETINTKLAIITQAARKKDPTFDPRNNLLQSIVEEVERNNVLASDGSKQFHAELCGNMIRTAYLIQNDEAREKAKAQMIKAGFDAATHFAKGKLLNSQASDVQEGIEKVNKFEPTDMTNDQLQATKCQLEPNAIGCPGAITGPQNFGRTGTQFTFSGGTGAPISDAPRTSGEISEGDEPTFNDPTTDDLSDDGGIGTFATNTPAKRGGLQDEPVIPPRKSGDGGNNRGGGGGGGGGMPSGSGGGGGGGGGPASGNNMAVGPAAKSNIQYGSGGGNIRYAGASSKGYKSKKSKSSNPFAGLFGKKGKKKGKTLLTFDRAPAGKSELGAKTGESIFKRITKRYSYIQVKDRVLKYEKKKFK